MPEQEDLLDEIDDLLDETEEFWAIDATDDVVDALTLAYTMGLADAATYMAELKGISVGVSFNVTDPAVLEILEEHAAEMVRNINKGTKFYLRSMISVGFKEGVSEENLVKTIMDGLFTEGDFTENRVRSICRFEINQAQSMGWVKQMKEVGVKQKQWFTIGEDACEVCKENEAMGPVPIDSKVFLTVFGGEKTGYTPAHPNYCRCQVTLAPSELDKLGTIEWYTGAAKAKSEVEERERLFHKKHADRVLQLLGQE